MATPVWALERVCGTGDREIARIAAAQHGFVVREQLFASGLARGAIRHRVRTGRLYERYRGVYLVGRPSIQPLGEEMAAVLLYRGHVILSHWSAAALWGLIERSRREVAVTIVGKDCHSKPGLRLFRVARLDQRDLRARYGLPLTAPSRTLIDLAGHVPADELERAVAEARVRGLASERELTAAIDRVPRRKGTGPLLRLLRAERGPAYTHSGGERRMLALLRAAELPQPLVNHRVMGYKLDFFWPDQRLVVELDGGPFHSHPRAFERDRKRDQLLVAAGYRVIRVTGRQLLHEPFAVIARIAQALRAS